MSETLDIKLLGKDYSVACSTEERGGLEAAVKLLDQRLREVGLKTHSSGERLAVMVALNLSHELLTQRHGSPELALESDSIQRRIDSIEAKLTQALAEHEQLF